MKFKTSEIDRLKVFHKGNHAFADLRYGEQDSISPNSFIFSATKG